MPVCPNCDSEDFELLNGLYFCNVCNVQSQDIVEEEFNDVKALAENSLRKTTKQIKTTKANVDRGKPWYTVEAFQVILKAQVSALIRLGCSPQLNDVVKQMWMKFVHKNGLAVINPNVKALRTPSEAKTTFRDQYLSGALGKKCLQDSIFPSVDNHFLKIKLAGRKRSNSSDSEKVSYKKKQKKRMRPGGRKNKSEEEFTTDRTWKSDEEWFSLASDLGNSSSVESTDSENFFSTSTKSKKLAQTYRFSSESLEASSLKLPSLIVMLNVALQWCREPITIGDLINWIKQGYLPYTSCVQSLLPHMKLTDFDCHLFKDDCLPTYDQISKRTEIMIEFLNIPPTLPEVDIRQLVSRYLVDLNLPLSLSAFVNSLMATSDYTYQRRRIKRLTLNTKPYRPELIAISLLVVSMKILFGLDDEREWLLDSSLMPCPWHGDNCEPFTWKDWSEYHLKRCMNKRKNPRSCFEAVDPEAVDDVHSYVEHWKNVVLDGKQVVKERKQKSKRSTRSLRETLEIKRWTFTKLCSLQGSNDEIEKRNLQRQFPCVVPSPSQDDIMSHKCLHHVYKAIETKDFDYIWYSAIATRIENFVNPVTADAQLTEGFHFSYDFILKLAAEMMLSDGHTIHCTVQNLERKLLSHYLVPRKEHKYSSTSWC